MRPTRPREYISKAEITFEDKYVAHDGGSIGAAIGAIILSCIEGFLSLNSIADVLKARSDSNTAASVPSSVVRNGLASSLPPF